MMAHRILVRLLTSRIGPSPGYVERMRSFGASDVTREGPLTGFRVTDLSRALAGPFCTMLLGDLGAEVIKVERPGQGDDSRFWGPPFLNSESAYFLSINRNKKVLVVAEVENSITIDLKTDQGQEIIRKLVSKSDILVENYLPGKLDKMNLGYQHLSEVNPALVYCSITGFGETGPYTKRACYDLVAAAIGGLMHITGPKGGDPCRVGVAMTDLSTGLYAYGAIMAALLDRHKTGRGQRVQCNLLSCQVALMTYLASSCLNSGWEPGRCGTAHELFVPAQAFKTKDGNLIIAADSNSQFVAMCMRIGLSELTIDPRFLSNKDRVTHREELNAILSERFAKHSTSHWLDVLEGSGFPYGPVNNMEQVFSDPQVNHLGIVDTVIHPTAGEVKFPGPAVSYSGFKQPVRLPPPTLGQHTREILQDLLGYDKLQEEN